MHKIQLSLVKIYFLSLTSQTQIQGSFCNSFYLFVTLNTERFNLNTPRLEAIFDIYRGGGGLVRNLIFSIDGKENLRKIFLLPSFQGNLRKKIDFFNFFRGGGVCSVIFPKISFFADIRGGI